MASPPSPKRERRSVREESRAVYRQAILDAAMRVFGKTGFRASKIAEIASEAGVATGTLYNYFASKEEIFQSILEDGRERLRTELERQRELPDPMLRLRGMVQVMFDFLEENGVLFTIYMQQGASPIHFQRPENNADEAFRLEVLELISGSIAEAGDHLRSDIPPQLLAMAFGGLMNGAVLGWVSCGCKPGLRESTDIIMDLFTNGAGRR